MDFNYSEEQNLLADSVTKFIQNDYSYEARRKRTASEDGFDRTTWNTFAELGWLAVPFDEEDGGIGGGPIQSFRIIHTGSDERLTGTIGRKPGNRTSDLDLAYSLSRYKYQVTRNNAY